MLPCAYGRQNGDDRYELNSKASLEARLEVALQTIASGKMPMLSRYANPFLVWVLSAVALFGQQPGIRSQQQGTQQSGNRPTQPAQQPQVQRNNAPQPGNSQAGAQSFGNPQQSNGAQQPTGQEPIQRTASATNGVGNAAVDRQAMEQQLAAQLAAQQAALAEQLAKPPFPQLNEQQQLYLDQVLKVWEESTAKIKRYQCNFKRWIYDPAQNTGADAAAKGEGVVRFMQPDKGLFKVEKVEFYAGRDEKQAATYRENDRQKFGEYWLCDGDYVHILDRNEKKCLKVQLPPEMRGQNIHLSPLPFLFGVKAQEIKSRYWVRPIAPPQGSKDVWLETYPKRPDDAGNYSRVQIVLDANEVLPKALIVFLPNWRADQQHREVYEFTERDKDWNMLDQMKDKLFRDEFIPQTLPKDWQIVVEPYQQEGPAPAAPNQQAGLPPATQPFNGPQSQQALPNQQQPMRQAQSPGANATRPGQPSVGQPSAGQPTNRQPLR